jgi:SAM-dependent methyltransferase
MTSRQLARNRPVGGVMPGTGWSVTDAGTIQPASAISVLSTLHCPYCGSSLESETGKPAGPSIEYGTVRCACHTYPIVEGIPILQHMDGLDRVLAFVRAGERKRALLEAFDVFRIRWARQTPWHRAGYYLGCRRLVSGNGLTFEGGAQLVRQPRVFADYLVHRYANPSFLAAIGPMMRLEQLADRPASSTGCTRVLDLACGAGHATFLMTLLHPNLSVISVDQDFVSLYLAKRFLVPDGTFVCYDVEASSPFPADFFDAIFCLDAFHYFKSKKAVVSELRRTSRTDALWLFPHLHNALQHNLVAGLPLSPEKYLECFDLPDARLFDEAEILMALSQRRVDDLETPLPGTRLDRTPTLTLMRGGCGTRCRRQQFPSRSYMSRHLLTVNPIYRGAWQGDALDLQLAWPNDTIRRECSSVTAILPSEWRLRKADLRGLRGPDAEIDCESLARLVARFILVPVPRGYCRTDLAAVQITDC